VAAGFNDGGGFRLDELLEDPLEAGADLLVHVAGLERGEQFRQVRLGEGHRRFSSAYPG
jgi:hypothetical protein